MLAFTHIAAGCATSVVAAQILHAPTEQSILILGGGVLGSMLPDIDHPESTFGRRILPISIPIAAIFGHRGITHSIFAVAGVSWLAWWAAHAVHWHNGYAVPVIVGIAVGYLSHLAGDYLTNSGVPLLWPHKRRFASPITICTGNIVEYLLAFAMYGWTAMECMRVFK